MPTTLKTIRLSKHGLPAVLLISEYRESSKKEINAYLIWPEQFGNYKPAVRLLKLSMPHVSGGRSADFDQVVETMRLAANAGIIHHASKFCAALDHPVDHVVIEDLDSSTLRAWRSIGLYKGIESEDLDWQTQTFVKADLAFPYGFTDT